MISISAHAGKLASKAVSAMKSAAPCRNLFRIRNRTARDGGALEINFFGFDMSIQRITRMSEDRPRATIPEYLLYFPAVAY
jgi:hypothetical protein